MSPRTTLHLVTAPTVDPVTVAEAKSHERIETSAHDTLIADMIADVVDQIDGAEGYLGRCLVQQEWDLKTDCFPSGGLPLDIPLAPLISIDSVTYVDTTGASQTLATSVYQVVGVGANMGGFMAEAFGQSWPSTRDQYEAVTVRFTAGYAPDTSVSPADARANVPAAIKGAIKQMVGYLYENREDKTVTAGEALHRTYASAKLARYRTRWAV